ncbi:hypothetical protein [Methylomagnum sp.]
MKIPFYILLACGNALAVAEAQPMPMGPVELDAVTAGTSSIAVGATGANSAQSSAASASALNGQNSTSSGAGLAVADGIVIQHVSTNGLDPLAATLFGDLGPLGFGVFALPIH